MGTDPDREVDRIMQESDLFHPGAGKNGFARLFCNLLLGKNNQRAAEIIAAFPWAEYHIRRVMDATPGTPTRKKRHRSRILLTCAFCDGPQGDMFRARFTPTLPKKHCRWCQELFQPKSQGNGHLYCCTSCRDQWLRFWKREREMYDGACMTPHTPGLQERLLKSMNRSRRQRATRRRNASAKRQAQLGLPNW